MKRIYLTGKYAKGAFAIVDDVDFERINRYKWYLSPSGYALRSTGNDASHTTLYMHREINKTPDGLFTDHIDQNKLDNTRSNLRDTDKSGNSANRQARVDNTSGHKGVWRDKSRGLWAAELHYRGKKFHLGRFTDIKEAAEAYNNKAVELFGEFAALNKVT